MKKVNYPASLLCDFYKVSHREQYPEGTQIIYSTWTPRETRIKSIDEVVAFGFQAFIKEYLIDYFNENFFKRPLEDVLAEYKRVIKYTLNKDNPDTSHLEKLWNFGFLPLEIKAIPEGMSVPIRVPMLTIQNTYAEFFWLTNFLETLMSCSLWIPSTSATIAKQYRKILDDYAEQTCHDNTHVDFQAHDFSMRGMGSLESSKMSGAGHLLSFVGTDSIPSILFMEKFYNANIETETVGSSIPATEHSVMSAGGESDEFETYRRLVEEIYPDGIFAVVSDTWDLWNVITVTLPKLKDSIMKRNGKMVIRPDSGNPVDILCGTVKGNNGQTPEEKGVIQLLYEIFGGTINGKGYKVLDSHIGAIYGDAITLSNCQEICERMKIKGYASSNFVLGVGSFTYQFNTRDTFGFALKSTYAVINDEEKFLSKDPKTGNGVKKSQVGKVAVIRHGKTPMLIEGLNELAEDNIANNLLETIFVNGKLIKDLNLSEIRDNIKNK